MNKKQIVSFAEAKEIYHNNAVLNMTANLRGIDTPISADEALESVGWTWEEYKVESWKRRGGK